MQTIKNEINILQTTEDKVSVQISSQTTFPEALVLIQTALLTIMKQADQGIPEIKEDVYDKVNTSTSRLLEIYAPEFELRPDLTAQAILEAENKILDRQQIAEVIPMACGSKKGKGGKKK